MDDETTAATDTMEGPPVITAQGLSVVGEHGPLFSDVDLELKPGFHAIQMPGGPAQHTLMLTLAGRLKPTHGTVTVCGETRTLLARASRRKRAFDASSIALSLRRIFSATSRLMFACRAR